METPSRRAKSGYFGWKFTPNHAAPDSKLGTIPQHGGAHAFFVIESAVGRIHILKIDVRFSHFQQASDTEKFQDHSAECPSPCGPA